MTNKEHPKHTKIRSITEMFGHYMSASAVLQINIRILMAIETLKSILCSQTSENCSNSKDIHVQPLEDFNFISSQRPPAHSKDLSEISEIIIRPG